jgi:hypothetical protein
MGHCPFEELGDLVGCLDQIRAWPGIREEKPGVFYVKRTPFLHFHVDRDGRRWADARNGETWREGIDAPRRASTAERQRFVRAVERCYRATARLMGV